MRGKEKKFVNENVEQMNLIWSGELGKKNMG